MSTQEILRAYWLALEARDWDRVATFLAPDVEVDLPISGASCRGREEFLNFNRTYPGDWHVEVVRVVAGNDEAAVEVAALTDGAPEACLGFYILRDGQITRAKEWWATPANPPDGS